MVVAASHRAAGLIREIAGGDPAGKLDAAGEVPPNPPDVKLRYEKCDALLGIKVGPKTGDEILSRFGLQKAGAGDGESTWRIPSFRRDLRREADLIEEIVRIFGIEKIPTNDRSRFTAVSRADVEFDSESKLRQRLVAHGLSEARTSALIPRGENLFVERAIELRNPLSEDHVVLRPALLPGLLRVLARNIRSGATTVRIFEMGRVFNAPDGSEKRHLGFVLHGHAERNPHWRGTVRRKLDLFDLKGALEGIGRQQLSFQRSKRRDLAVAAEVTCGPETMGFIGQLMAAHANELGATGPVVVGEIAVEPILELFSRVQTFREIDKFPSVTRDIAMIVPEQLSHAEIFSVIKKVPEPLLAAVELFDLFSGEGGMDLGAGKKSLAYTLTYRDKARTLTNDEINVIHARIRERLKEELSVELRE
jgi:phenylalanyl-tRNA synthetase beta chain